MVAGEEQDQSHSIWPSASALCKACSQGQVVADQTGLLTKYCGPTEERKGPSFIHQPDKVRYYYSHNVTRCMGSVKALSKINISQRFFKKKAVDQK